MWEQQRYRKRKKKNEDRNLEHRVMILCRRRKKQRIALRTRKFAMLPYAELFNLVRRFPSGRAKAYGNVVGWAPARGLDQRRFLPNI